MRKILNVLSLGVLFMHGSLHAYAQNSTNYLQVINNTALNFNINDPADLENAQTLNNALTLMLRSKSRACNVSAKISNYSTPPGFVPTSSPIQLDFSSTTASNTSYINYSTITLSTYDQLLFSQYKSGSTNYYYYDVVMGPLDYSYGPGNYSFTVLFTMVQP